MLMLISGKNFDISIRINMFLCPMDLVFKIVIKYVCLFLKI